MEDGDRQKDNQEETKICSKCKLPKLKSLFGKLSNSKDGLRHDCKECRKLYYTSEHALMLGRLSDKRRSGTNKRLASNLKATKKYGKSDKGKIKYKRWEESEMGKLNHKRYHQTEKGILSLKINSLKRRDRSLKHDIEITKEDILLIYKRFNNQCFNCRSNIKLSIDHHYPLSKGFGIKLSNAVLLCRSCNARKHNKLPEIFYTEEKLLILNKILGI